MEQAYSLGEALLRSYKNDSEIYFLLGLVCEQTAQLKLARKHATKSIKNSKHPDPLFLLSRIERSQGNTDAALEICDHALDFVPDSLPLLIHRAGTLEEAGRIEEARAVIDPLIDQLESGQHPVPTELRFELAKLLVQEGEYQDAVSLINDLVTDQTGPAQLNRLQYYLLAKAHDRLNQFQYAFDAATAANRIGELEFDPSLYEQQVTMLIDQWSAERIAKFPTSSCEDELPVFIAGMPRSGTSLIDQIIDAHPRASGVGELSTIEIFAQQLSAAYKPDLEPPACFGRFDRFRWSRIARDYVQTVQDQSPPESIRVVNKALGNNKLVGLLASLFPRTRVIHALRDPRDVAISCYMGGFNDRVHPWTTRIPWINTAWEQSQRMMDHWKAVLKIQILDVQYDQLVTNPELHAPRLIEFLGLDWDENCMRFYKSKRTVRTLSYDQVNRPIYTSSVGRHKNYSQYMNSLHPIE